MKLKQFIIPVAGALLLGGCEADHRNDNLLDSVVYLLESDLQKALFYDIEETTDYSFRAFSSGYTVTPSELGIELRTTSSRPTTRPTALPIRRSIPPATGW